MKIALTIILILFYALFSFSNNAEVIEYKTSIVIKKGKKTETCKIKIQVNNSNGNIYGKFNLPYSKILKLKKLKGRITDIEGDVIQTLKSKSIKTSSYFNNYTFYNDNLEKSFWLQHNTYPYIIECEFTYTTSSFIDICNWSPVWDTEIPTHNAQLEFTYPKNYLYNSKETQVKTKQVLNSDLTKTILWESKYEPIDRTNTHMPLLNDLIPNIILVPKEFKYITKGSFNSWQTFGNYMSEITTDLDELTDFEKNVVDDLTLGLTNKFDIIKTLYYYLQLNTRYVNVNIKYGGLKPYPAKYVCIKKYGDCKALTNYMKALLKYKNINSHLALVYAGNNPPKIDTNFPHQQFNHVILCVPLNNDSIWLECTANSLPVNYLGSFTQNRKALIINGKSSKLVSTPTVTTSQSQTINSYSFNSINKFKSEVNVQSKIKGKGFEYLRELDSYSKKEKTGDFISDFINLENVKVENWKIQNENKDSIQIGIWAKATCNNPVNSIAEYIKIDHPDVQLPKFEKTGDRFFDVKINYPITTIDTLTYNSDFADYKTNSNEKIFVESEFGIYSIERNIIDNKLQVIRSFIIPNQYINLEKYDEFYSFYKALLKDLSATTVTKQTH